MILDIRIHDVGHGGCAVATAPNGKRLMVDCGHSSDLVRPWSPSVAYAGIPIECLVVSNYDEDHVSNLPELVANVPLGCISRNTSVSAVDLAYLKLENGAGRGISTLSGWMGTPASAPTFMPDLGGMVCTQFWCHYPSDFVDENNLSVVTFVEWGPFSIVFPGDLEASGWSKLLERPLFRTKLAGVNVFVASHHGRTSGCCDDVFAICGDGPCYPEIVVMSDRDKQFDSQETLGWYAYRCRGIPTQPSGIRKVYTTRNDGHLVITVGYDGRWVIAPEYR